MSADLRRIEALYAGEVGAAYTTRSAGVPPERRFPFWAAMYRHTLPASVLEVGCGSGQNLLGIACAARLARPELWGVDVNAGALAEAAARLRGWPLHTAVASAVALPFKDQSFDLVFTAGVLMHVPAGDLPGAMDELVRVSSRYVLTIEYEDVAEREIPWHGLRDVLWARPVALNLWRRHPGLVPVDRGQLIKAQGFDRMEWALFRRQEDWDA